MNTNQRKQHKHPCSTCPFLRSSVPGELGGSPVQTFIGQCYGSFWIPCHEVIDYDDPNWKTNYNTPQCAGAAIYRANVYRDSIRRPGQLLSLPEDFDKVFGSPAQLLAHHTGCTIASARVQLEFCPDYAHHHHELLRAGAKPVPANALKKGN